MHMPPRKNYALAIFTWSHQLLAAGQLTRPDLVYYKEVTLPVPLNSNTTVFARARKLGGFDKVVSDSCIKNCPDGSEAPSCSLCHLIRPACAGDE